MFLGMASEIQILFYCNYSFPFKLCSCLSLINPFVIAEEGSSWDMVSDNDLWEEGNAQPDQEDYVLVRQEDIVEGIACFMAAYLLSLKQTKVCVSCHCCSIEIMGNVLFDSIGYSLP